jgi:hypothetical protein
MATTLVNPAAGFGTYALQARTDAAGDPVDDVTGEDLRLLASLFSEGVVGADSFQVTERGAGANMSVDVGSGAAFSDLAVVAGTASGQGNYVVRLGDAVTNVSVNASNVSNPRIDEIYLVVQDNQYDASGRVIARLAYRDGTPAGSPAAPGPDGAWDAYLLLASVLVGAGVTSVVTANITDERPKAGSNVIDQAVVVDNASAGNVGSAISTTYVTSVASTFTPPAGWLSFDLFVEASVAGAVGPTGSGVESGDVGARVGIGGDFGSTMFSSGVTDGTVRSGHSVFPTHQRVGLSGAQSVVAQIRKVPGSGAATVYSMNGSLRITAVRKT